MLIIPAKELIRRLEYANSKKKKAVVYKQDPPRLLPLKLHWFSYRDSSRHKVVPD